MGIALEVVDVDFFGLKGLEDLDAGECAAIALTEQMNADLLIIDERLGRTVARTRGLNITGLLGILREAGQQKWIDLPSVFTNLRKTSFRVSDKLLQQLIEEVND
jgi:predicted nucleic acid-binding protein